MNEKIFATLAEARVVIERWRIDYNRVRLHSTYGGLTPEAVRLNPAATQIGYQPNPPAPTQVWSKASGTPIGNY